MHATAHWVRIVAVFVAVEEDRSATTPRIRPPRHDPRCRRLASRRRRLAESEIFLLGRRVME